jgi:hypothetical protein
MRSIFIVLLLLLFSCSSKKTQATNKPAPSALISKSWLGKWERQIWQNGATLEIKTINGDSLEFSLVALNGANTGEIEGKAIVRDNVAVFSSVEDLDSCLLEFKLLGDSAITINQIRRNCFAGLEVIYSGDYKNAKMLPPIERAETLVDLGIFNSEKQDSAFRSLVGSNYSRFVNSTQLTSEDDDLDGLHATVQSSGVRGLFTFEENIIMMDSIYNIWAAVIDNEKVYYFTNNQAYKNKLPKTIDNWRENFKNYEIVYK